MTLQGTLKTNRKKSLGFTLIEMLIAVAIVGLIAAVAVPALLRAKSDSWNKQVEGTRKTLNEAVTRAILKHKTSDGVNLSTLPPELQSEDPEVVITYLVVNGYIQ